MGASFSKILDRYGNEYWSLALSLGVEAGVPWAYWEGYVVGSGLMPRDIVPTESELRDIVHGKSFGPFIQMGPGLALDLGANGYLLLYGENISVGAGASFGSTWFRGKSDTSWHWVDEIQGYDSSIRNAAY